MLRSKFCTKIIAGMMLVAFCVAAIIFQNINLKNYYSIKVQQEASVDQSFNGQLGLLEEENQTSNNTLEEEDDEFKIDSIFFAAQHYEQLTQQFFIIQENLFRENHSEIISPPPQG